MRQVLQKHIRKLRKKLGQFRSRLNDRIEIRASKHVDIQDVKSVCLTLGPYRNLTTLTATVLFLHPNCQVLNHAGKRVFGIKQVDFLMDYTKEKLNRFIQYAINLSGKGQRGSQGGSITYSHAFDSNHETKEIFAKTGSELVKKQIICLFWKESLRTSKLIRERHVDLASIFKSEDRLRFLLPIRHPLDCAVSNRNRPKYKKFPNLNKDSSIFDVVQAVLDEIFWFADLKEKFPDRFHYYYQHEISKEMLVNLAKFLQLDPSEEWITNALTVMKIKSGYNHNDELINFYRDYVFEKGSKFPELSKGLLLFIE